MNAPKSGNAPFETALLDIRLLRLFEALYATASVTRAAERLGQSQPTASIWLGKLRLAIRDPLFVRSPQGMRPTPRAEELIGIAREALSALRRLSESQRGFDPAEATRSFRVAMTDASHITLLPQLLARVRAVAPQVKLVASRIDADIAGTLRNGEADLAVGLVPELESGFYQQTLFEQDWICLANAAHPRLGRSLSLPAYRDEAHVGIIYGTGFRLLETALHRQKLHRRVVLELPGFLGLPAILSKTDLIATLPRQIGESLALSADLRAYPCPLPIDSFTVKQHWHERYHHDPANRWLRELCAETFTRARGLGPFATAEYSLDQPRGRKRPNVNRR